MDPTFDFKFDIFILFGVVAIGQALILSVYHLSEIKKNGYPAVLLAVLLLTLAFPILHDVSIYSRHMLQSPFLYGTGGATKFLIGPLIYFFTLSVARQNWKFRLRHLLHFIPFLVYNLLLMDVYLLPSAEKIESIKVALIHDAQFPNILIGTFSLAGFFQIFLEKWLHPIIYILLSVNLHQEFVKNLKNRFERGNTIWIKNVIIGYSSVILIHLIINLLFYFISKDVLLRYPSLSIALSVHIIVFSYLSLKRGTLMNSISSIDGNRFTIPRLSGEKSNAIYNRVVQLMEVEKLFKDHKLTAQALAQQIGTNVKYVSQSINQERSINFHEFINGYRINEAAKRLADEDSHKYTIEHIGEVAGFKSKSAFYSVFKKHYGMTPKQFKRDSTLKSGLAKQAH